MKYSIFFLLLTLLAYVVYTKQQKEIDTEKVISATTAQFNKHKELMEEMVLDKQGNLQHFLNEPTKQKYNDINTAAFIVANAPEEIIHQLNEQQQLVTQFNDQDNLTDFIKKTNKDLLEISKIMFTGIEKLLTAAGKQYGLKGDEIKDFLGEVQPLCELTPLTINNIHSRRWQQWQFAKKVSEIRTVQLKLISRLSTLAGGRTVRCFGSLYPIVSLSQNVLSKGDTCIMRIGLGQYSTPMEVNDFKIEIGSDTIFMNSETGYYDYKVAFQRDTTLKINATYKIRAYFTGEEFENKSYSSYDIHVQ